VNPLRRIAEAFGYRLDKRRRVNDTIEAHLANLLPELGVNCVVDVGGNEGQFGRLLRGIGYRHRIVSLEPVRSVYELLAEGASGDREWTTFPLALGAAPSRMRIHVPPSTQFASFREASEYGRSQFATRMEGDRTEEVEVSTLDAMWPRFVEGIASPVVFVKLDTQGYDMEVLKGGARSIPRIAGVQCELAVKHIYEGVPGYLEVLRALAGMGFELTGLYPITREDKTLSIIEMDCVMRRP
jgi:FkbM family methyltransferase